MPTILVFAVLNSLSLLWSAMPLAVADFGFGITSHYALSSDAIFAGIVVANRDASATFMTSKTRTGGDAVNAVGVMKRRVDTDSARFGAAFAALATTAENLILEITGLPIGTIIEAGAVLASLTSCALRRIGARLSAAALGTDRSETVARNTSALCDSESETMVAGRAVARVITLIKAPARTGESTWQLYANLPIRAGFNASTVAANLTTLRAATRLTHASAVTVLT